MVMGTEAHNLQGIAKGFKSDNQFPSDENSIVSLDAFNRSVQQPYIRSASGFELGTTYPFLDPANSLKLDLPAPFFDSICLMDFHDVPYALDRNNCFPTSSSTSGPSLITSPSSNRRFSSSPTSDPSSGSNLSMNISPEGDHHDDTEIFSDVVLTYINNMLMEENMDEKLDMYQEPSVVQATEKLLSDLIDQSYSPSVVKQPQDSSIARSDGLDDGISGEYCICSNSSGSNDNSSEGVDRSWSHTSSDYKANLTRVFSGGLSSQSSFSSSNTFSSLIQGSEDFLPATVTAAKPAVQGVAGSLLNSPTVPDNFLANLPAWQFMKGVEEARKFLPSQNKLVIDLEANGAMLPLFAKKEKTKAETKLVEVKDEQEENENSINILRGRKHAHYDDLDLEEGRSVKQSAVYAEGAVRTEMFDRILLCHDESCGENGKAFKEVLRIREAVQNAVNKSFQDNHAISPGTGRGRGKRQAKKELVDLSTLLIHCAQMAAADDRRGASELLKQIRQHSSPCGDGSQRLAHFFADGLEARLAGTGSQIYHSLVSKRRSASSILKAYQLYLAACPFRRITYFVANRTILDVAEKSMRVHIIDFGIYYGFQWPVFIQRLGSRPGGPPKLRITGIDMPQPGFRPAERIEETGQRLADYALSFDVPFEYQAIASKWEDIRVEDLRIDKDELLIVNCLHRNQNLLDETVLVDSPRDMFLNNIRGMNPNLFILGVVNGTFNAPFFITRFREALFHYSALYDMLETNVPREEEHRGLIESELFGREALNVISCEGAERVERPESYKQWQARNIRAGFEQVQLNQDIIRRAKDKVRGSYHKDFIVDEDSRWLVQGWKGRITQAISVWKPHKVR